MVEADLQVRKEANLNMVSATTTVVSKDARQESDVENRWFSTYVTTELGNVRDCEISQTSDRKMSISRMVEGVVES